MDRFQQDLGDLYADMSACLLTISNALTTKGLLTKEEIAEAAQERLLAMQPSGKPDEQSPSPYVLLKMLAVDLPSTPQK